MLDSGLLEAAGHALEAVHRLFPEPLHDASSAVAVGDVISERGKTLWLAPFLPFPELFLIEFLIFHPTPIVFRLSPRDPSPHTFLPPANPPIFSPPPHPPFPSTP